MSTLGSKPVVNLAGSDKILNIDSIGNSVWLVKVPIFVAERWSEANTNDNLGNLTILSTTEGKKVLVNLSENGDDDNQPKEFTLEEFSSNESNNDQHLIAFEYNETKESYRVQGQITKRSILRPKQSVAYKQVIINRGIKASTHHEAQVASRHDLESRATSHVVDFIPPAHTDLKRKAQDSIARAAKGAASGSSIATIDTEILRGKLFEAFTINDRQSMKELIVYCHDANTSLQEKDIKELLDKYARYHSKGTYRGYWELKAEYQDKSKTSSSSSSSSSDNK